VVRQLLDVLRAPLLSRNQIEDGRQLHAVQAEMSLSVPMQPAKTAALLDRCLIPPVS